MGAPGTTDSPGNGVLRLTTNETNQSGFVIYNQPVQSGNGLTATFNFYSYGGSGADGFSFFFIEGTASPTHAGGLGGSLGYAQNTVANQPGLVGGYAGIGFDEFGNFSNPTEGRQGGPGAAPNTVAIRGAGSGFDGYQYLTGTTLPASQSLAVSSATTRAEAQRTARINLSPANQISVDIDFGNGFVNVIPPTSLAALPGQPAFPSTFKFGFSGAPEGQPTSTRSGT